MVTELKGAYDRDGNPRYIAGASPSLIKIITERLPFFAFDEAMDFYASVVGHLNRNELALLGCNDRFFLVTGLLNRVDAIHPWIYDRAREVEADPDGYLDLWARFHYKDLCTQTNILTPSGWKLHGSLLPGDVVYGADGKPTRVVAVTEHFTDGECYRVGFRDGASIIAGGGHLWRIDGGTPAIVKTAALPGLLADGFGLQVSMDAGCEARGFRQQSWKIVRVERVETVATNCIQVESPDGMYLAGRELIPTHNSTLNTFAGAIQECIIDPETRICIFANTKAIAKPFLKQIKEELESNDLLKDTYPDVLYQNPTKESPTWSLDDGLTVKRKGNPRECTFEAHGLIDAMPTGKHFPFLFYDDIITEKNVTNEEQIKKASERTELSFPCGIGEKTRKRFSGTRYHFADSYGHLIEHGIAIPRLHPATEDGTINGTPVFMSPEAWEKCKREMRSQIAAQMLQNPIAGQENTFFTKWLRPYFVRPAMLNVYIMGDPSKGRHKSSDRTALAVCGIDVGKNKYLLDGYCHRMQLSERWEKLDELHRKWTNMPGVQLVKVGYERYGMQSDIEYFEEKMTQRGHGFAIEELNWTGEGVGRQGKKSRVERLEPDFRNEKFYIPGKVWHPGIDTDGHVGIWSITEGSDEIQYHPYLSRTKEETRAFKNREISRLFEPIKRLDEDDNVYDLVRVFFEEFRFFPFSPRDDFIDAMSRIYDLEPAAPSVFEKLETQDYADY
jgi:hypothetical protein